MNARRGTASRFPFVSELDYVVLSGPVVTYLSFLPVASAILSRNARAFLERIAEATGRKLRYVTTGPDKDDVIKL